MSETLRLTNARLVLPDGVADRGSVRIQDGQIAAIDPAAAPDEKDVDLKGAWLMPGLVDLHSDAIERVVQPRPGARLPLAHAVTFTDGLFATAGVTTVCHAIFFGDDDFGLRSTSLAESLVNALSVVAGSSLVEHLVNARCEVTSDEACVTVHRLVAAGAAQLVSLNDHTPGQGQFPTDASLVDYLSKRDGRSAAEAQVVVDQKRAAADAVVERARAMAAAVADKGIELASHDDLTLEDVRLAAELGVGVAEFPMSADAARAATESGIAVAVGAPNALRGGSTGSGPSAAELIDSGLATCICSDYAPETLLPAAFRLADELGWPMHRVVHLFAGNPASAIGLEGRGRIALGQRADLIAVDHSAAGIRVVGVWRGGQARLRCDTSAAEAACY